jgi:hypothetical protein
MTSAVVSQLRQDDGGGRLVLRAVVCMIWGENDPPK